MQRLALATALLLGAVNAASLSQRLAKHVIPVKGTSTLPKFMIQRKLEGEEEEAEWSFDVASYSFKYARCQMIEQYSDEMAQEEDFYNSAPLKKQRFAVFRLCPTSSCSNSKQFGCDGTYGEYLVDLGTYLQVMQEYKEEKENSYCEYCEQCAQGNNRKLEGEDEEEEEGEEADNEEEEREEEEEDEEEEDEPEEEEEVNYCQDSICTNYADTCEEEEADEYADDPIEYEQYFECAQAEIVEGNEVYVNGEELALYVGPHCTSGGKGIKLDLFYDEFCTEYAGNKYSLNTLTGISFSDTALQEFYEGDCVSCKESDNVYENAEYDNEDEDEITELCVDLYQESAKCEDNLPVSSYGYAAKSEDSMTCTYINNIVKGSYNEKGQIYLNLKEYRESAGYNSDDTEVTGGQAFWLSFFIIGSVGIAGYAAFLHKQLTGGKGMASTEYSGGSMA